MSDKETNLVRAWQQLRKNRGIIVLPESGWEDWQAVDEAIALAVECRAPAPQPPFDRLPLLVDAVQKFLKHDGGPGSEDYNASEIYHARRSMQAAFGFRCPRCGETLPHLYDENCTDYRAATPQVTPTDQPMMCDSCKWAMVANCFHCPGCGKEIRLAPEGTSEQASPTPDRMNEVLEVRKGFGTFDMATLAADEFVAASGLRDGGWIVYRKKAGEVERG